MTFVAVKNIYCSGTGLLYLRRWAVDAFGRFGIKLHRFYHPDIPVWHDHPWPFVSVCLWGGYTEHRPLSVKGAFDARGELHRTLRMRPGRFIRRQARDLHYLTDIKLPTYTLVISGHRCRAWGFVQGGKWIYWRAYVEQPGSLRMG